jgi:hypothetical protein
MFKSAAKSSSSNPPTVNYEKKLLEIRSFLDGTLFNEKEPSGSSVDCKHNKMNDEMSDRTREIELSVLRANIKVRKTVTFSNTLDIYKRAKVAV